MAKGVDGKPAGDDADHEEMRASNRAEIIRQVCMDLAKLEAERKTIGKQISKLKAKRVKGDLGMKITDFNMAFRAYQLDEPEDRDALLDTLRETFEALGIGGQLDFLHALAAQKEKEAAAGIKEPNGYA